LAQPKAAAGGHRRAWEDDVELEARRLPAPVPAGEP